MKNVGVPATPLASALAHQAMAMVLLTAATVQAANCASAADFKLLQPSRKPSEGRAL